MDKLAEKLNETLKETEIYGMLSDYGRRMFVPKGIIVQSSEAKAKASRFNATIGVALDNGNAMFINGMRKQFSDSIMPGEIFPYAPMGGVTALREKWLEEMIRKNPSLKGKKTSKPIVCNGITNALSLVFSLFTDKDEEVVLPSMYWENYNLIIDEQRQARKVLFDTFDGNGFNIKGFDKALASTKGPKISVLMNFPNNPTGYTPTNEEANEIVSVLKKHADAGKKIVVISDDAYFGLFYEKNVCRESLFAKLCDVSENLLAVKCDGASKEEMVWGFRIAFITYAFKGCDDASLDALMQKTMGAIRGSLSSCSLSGQSILLKGMSDSDYESDKKAGADKIAERFFAMKNALANYSDNKCLKPYPFNSGYFMSFETKCNAEDLRQELLENWGIGTICLGEHLLRLAFCSVEANNIEDLVKDVYSAAEKLC